MQNYAIESTSEIIEVGELTNNLIKDLIDKKLMAIRIPFFAPLNMCNDWVYRLINQTHFGRYSFAPEVAVQRMGMPLFETENTVDKLELYFKEAERLDENLSIIFKDSISPLQYLVEEIGKSWDKGIEVMRLNNRKMSQGLLRRFEANDDGGLPVHQDILVKDMPDKSFNDFPISQLAANLYIEIPQSGGGLEIWNYEPSFEEAKQQWINQYDFLDRNELPGKPILLKPRVGELILFRSGCIHAVQSCSGNFRTSASCFIGYYGDDMPLKNWS